MERALISESLSDFLILNIHCNAISNEGESGWRNEHTHWFVYNLCLCGLWLWHGLHAHAHNIHCKVLSAVSSLVCFLVCSNVNYWKIKIYCGGVFTNRLKLLGVQKPLQRSLVASLDLSVTNYDTFNFLRLVLFPSGEHCQDHLFIHYEKWWETHFLVLQRLDCIRLNNSIRLSFTHHVPSQNMDTNKIR